MMLGVIKNNNNSQATVIAGTDTSTCFYISVTGMPQLPSPPTSLATNQFGWGSYGGQIAFTAGYWIVTLYSNYTVNANSLYASSAIGASLCDYQLGLIIDPNSTNTLIGGKPYSFATNGCISINQISSSYPNSLPTNVE